MLQIGLNGLLTYVKASQRSATIDELLLSKDYISEIITMAADHFTTVSTTLAACQNTHDNVVIPSELVLGASTFGNMSSRMYVELSQEVLTISHCTSSPLTDHVQRNLFYLSSKNKFRPSLPRVIYKKMSGPNEVGVARLRTTTTTSALLG